MQNKYYLLAAVALAGVIPTEVEANCYNMNTNSGAGTTSVSQGTVCFGNSGGFWGGGGWDWGHDYSSGSSSSDFYEPDPTVNHLQRSKNVATLSLYRAGKRLNMTSTLLVKSSIR